jgi:hypothetical protein
MGKVRRPSKIVWLGSLLAVGLAIAIAWLLSVLFAPPLGLFSPLGLLWRCPDSVRGNFTFSRDGQLLGYRTPDEFVVRRTKDGREVWRRKLPGHSFSFCVPLPSKDLVAIYHRGQKLLEFWQLRDGKVIKQLPLTVKGEVLEIHPSPDGQYLFVEMRGRLALYRTDDARLIRFWSARDWDLQSVGQVAFDAKSQTIALVTFQQFKKVRVQWRRLPDGALLARWEIPFIPTSLSFSSDGCFLAIGGYQMPVRQGVNILPIPLYSHFLILRLPKGQVVFRAKLKGVNYYLVRFSPNGRFLVTVGESLRLWRVGNWELISDRTFGRWLQLNLNWARMGWKPLISLISGIAYDPAFSPDGQFLAMWVRDGVDIDLGFWRQSRKDWVYLFCLSDEERQGVANASK